MAYLRIALIVLSILAALALFGMLKNSWMYRGDEVAMMWIVLTGVGLNFVYLASVRPTNGTIFAGLFSRPLRMFRLWLDAKESDLKRRSTH
jgi:hypothetical protein